ncbi:MAG: 30S ribosomal protein S12 methylthiotransferase RimO [Eubacteriales Family XIII. Incertae Sedis bacterium]|mgnify:FL=1|nr:MAG: 30S ribosomal protein S12 methylthiotransferase RimO [Clostridiales Family XIII bacterium]
MKIFIETLGCPKNFNDSEFALGILERAGHKEAERAEDADLILVNTCGFINDAKKESIAKIFEMAEIAGENKILAISGCLSERYKDELYKEMPEVDIFIGVNDYDRLPALIEAAAKDKEGQKLSFRSEYCDFNEPSLRKIPENPYTATIKIAEGCNNICTYCIIPHIRGKYRSRKIEEITEEAKRLASSGTKELIIIAQDTTYYGMDIYGRLALPELLKELCKIDGIRWIRLMYCYEDKITDELIDTMASEEKICHYIDIPIQHSSDRILKAMNRKSTKTSIMSTMSKLRAKMPDINIRTTLITGFPGETEEDFDELYNFVSEMKFERLGIFAYSREEGTPADKMKGHIRQDIKEKRRDSIMLMQTEISLSKNREKIGKTIEVIVDGKDDDGSYYGRSSYDAPEIDNAVLFTSEKELHEGDFINVKITDAFDYDLVGEAL